MLRNYAKRVASVRYNSTKPATTDIDALLERVKNLTKDIKQPSTNQYNAGGNRNNNRQNGNYNRNREGGGQNRSNRPQRNFRSDRRRESETVGAAPLKVGINATSNVNKRSAGSNIDSSIGDLMVSTPGFDVGVDGATQQTQRVSREGGFKRSYDNNRPRRDFNSNREGGNNFRGDGRPGFRRNVGAPGLRAKGGRQDRTPKRKRDDKKARPDFASPRAPKIEIKVPSNIELLDTQYKPSVPTSSTLLATSPLLSNDSSSRVLRAIRTALQNPNADLGAIVKGDLREVDISQYSKHLKTENLKQNATVVVNALNRTNRLDYSTKMKILGPLIGASPVKELPLRYKEIQQ